MVFPPNTLRGVGQAINLGPKAHNGEWVGCGEGNGVGDKEKFTKLIRQS